MKSFFAAYGRFVGRRPVVALAVVAAFTVLAIAGFAMTADQADENEAFLPEGSDLIAAQEKLAANFPQSSGLESVQIVFRGDVLTPAALTETLQVTQQAAAGVLADFVVQIPAPSSPGHIVTALLADGGDPTTVDLASMSQNSLDAELAAARNDPAQASLIEALDSIVATDGGETVGGIGVITVNNEIDADALIDAQLSADDTIGALELQALDSASTISLGKTNQESDDANQTSLGVLMLIAFLVIALLLGLFYRQVSDVLLSLGGLILTIVWALGFQGLLGPDGLGVIGAPSVLGTMVPVMMIGLCVDYGIQGTSRYRESCGAGEDASTGISSAVASVMLPLGLAGVTTIISFLTNLFGDIAGLGDFGVVAGVGVASGLFIFLTGVPAVRVLIDRRAEARGKELTTRPMDQAIPGAGALVEGIGNAVVRKPTAILLATGIVTVVLGGLATDLDSSFNSNDFLPDGSESKNDIVFLQDTLGGNSEVVTVLIESDLTSDRTLRNLIDFSDAIEDPLTRPEAVSSGVTQSLGVFFNTLPADVALEINSLVENLENPLFIPPDTMEEILDLMEAADPAGFAQVVARGEGDAPDFTILQFNALTADAERTRELFADVDRLWFGNPDEITPIANEILAIEVTDALTESQGTSILLTIVAALIVLIFFFWFTEFRPMLAVLSVFPILLVLIWVLGTMVILGFSYNVVTALITALSIGIGVDYTIHITHRFLEEREHGSTLQEAVSATMRTTGGALIGSALTTALGFAVLLFSPIPPMGQFGLLTAITVLYSLIAAIVVLPPMLVIWAAYHDWREEHFVHSPQHNAAPGVS
ncbi:MAG: MMPL family transporter [Actinomycetota bacterium]